LKQENYNETCLSLEKENSMKKFIKEQWVTLSAFLLIMLGYAADPGLTITISGGFAWIFMVVGLVLIGWIAVSIAGGSMSYEAEGLIPRIKRWRDKNK
jgi:hypothetical protein